MRQHGIPKQIIGQIILDEVKNEIDAYYSSHRTLNRRLLWAN